MSIAVREAKALFPKARLSVITSLSTGSSTWRGEEKGSPAWLLSWLPSCIREIHLHKRFAHRLCRILMALGASERAWKQVTKVECDGNGQLFRFDIQYDGMGPSLDNTTDLLYMDRLATTTIRASSKLYQLADTIRAELFFFELDDMPQFGRGGFVCYGSIRCRLSPGSDGLVAVKERLKSANATFLVQKAIVPVPNEESPKFECKLTLKLRSRRELFHIWLCEEGSSCEISGSPFTIEKLAEMQHLSVPFGSADHREPQDSLGTFDRILLRKRARSISHRNHKKRQKLR